MALPSNFPPPLPKQNCPATAARLPSCPFGGVFFFCWVGLRQRGGVGAQGGGPGTEDPYAEQQPPPPRQRARRRLQTPARPACGDPGTDWPKMAGRAGPLRSSAWRYFFFLAAAAFLR